MAVLLGGVSAEREVSQRSGAAVAKGLRAAGYEVVEVDIRDRGIGEVPRDVDAVFVALHGEFGEDGKIQKLLREAGIPHTGSSPAASEVAFDKRLSKRIFIEAGIPTPRYEILRAGSPRCLPLPAVVKPSRQGSSIGVHRVFQEAEWPSALEDAVRYDQEAIVETYIPGRELTVGIVGEEALPVIEIVAPDGWYDYNAKYTQGVTSYKVPAVLVAETGRLCRDIAMRTFKALGCRGFARVDLRLSPDGRPYVLELNSIPGFTETSLLPKAAQAASIGFSALCDRIMRLADI